MARYLHQLSVRSAAKPQPRSRRARAIPCSGNVVLLVPLASAGLAVTALGHQVGLSIDEDTPVVFGGIDDGRNKQYLAMLAWSVLMATSLVLALLLQAVAATALDVPEQTARPAAHSYDAPATLPGGTLYATPESCSVPATDGKACIS
jgi:hypothetical protein